jgi:hypothetical protein
MKLKLIKALAHSQGVILTTRRGATSVSYGRAHPMVASTPSVAPSDRLSRDYSKRDLGNITGFRLGDIAD